MKKVGFISLGCPKNLVDSEVMISILIRRGYQMTNDPKVADYIIINTCGFIGDAKKESIDTILEFCNYKTNGVCSGIIVTGCLAQRYPEELLAEIPEIDGILGTGDFHRVADILDQIEASVRPVFIQGILANESMDHTPEIQLTPPYTAYVKIAEGCNHRCSFCIIPALRGRLISRSERDVVKDIQSKLERGVQEIILIAQDVTQYGLDRHEKEGLLKLLKTIIKECPPPWLRLLYTYPGHFSRALMEFIAGEERVLNYVDIPLQHINDTVLYSMERHTNRNEIWELIHNLRFWIPDITIRSTFIVGYPGETDAQFQELVDFIQEARLDRAGFFAYSQEEGTKAGMMKNQLPDTVKQDRLMHISTIQRGISRQINQSYRGKVLDVLVESTRASNGFPIIGRTFRDSPEIDGHIFLTGEDVLPGNFVRAKVTKVGDYDLFGKII